MTRKPLIPAAALAAVALLLWLASLPLTALAIPGRHITGGEILLTGWLGIFWVGIFYVAWFANPLFLWSLLTIRRPQPAVGPLIWALLLSLDTFRVVRYAEGESSVALYGYGWGAVLWFLALGVLAVAVGTRLIESRVEADDPGDPEDPEVDTASFEGVWLRRIGFAVCIVVPAIAIYFAMSDRRVANSEESARLSGLVTKRGAVCRAQQPRIAQSLSNFSGPLEVKSDASLSSALWAFDHPTYLLDRGVPIVRLDDRDYAYAEGDRSVVMSVPAAGPVAATLFMGSSTTDAERSVTAKLVDDSTGGVLFEHAWRQEARSAGYCPDFSAYAENGEAPMKTLREALGLSATPIPPKAQTADRLDNRVEGVIKGFMDGTPADDAVPGGALTLRANNSHCPEDTGWREWANQGRVLMGDNIAFVVGNRTYHRPAHHFYNALCAGSEAYLYSGVAVRDRYFLSIEKRRLADFAQSWSGTLEVSAQGLATAAEALVLDGVEEADGRLTVRLLNRATGRFTSVVSAVPQ